MILLTGGLGFLGSYIAAYLVSQKQKVVLTSHRRTEPLPLLKQAVASGQAQVVPCDVASREEVFRIVNDYKITSIIHAAHRPSYQKPEELYDITYNNVVSDMNISEACRRGKLKMTFISSSTVYDGLGASPPMMEDMALPVISSNITGAFKRAGEHILWMFASEFGLDFRIVRPPRIYGPYYRTFRNPVHRMMEAAAAGESITLPKVPGGSGGDFIYAEDLGRAIGMIHLAEKTKYRIYNAGGGTFYSYRQIADVVERLRPGIRIELGPDDAAALSSNRWVDITRLTQEFGYRAAYDIEKGHRAWFDWYLKGKPSA